MATDKLINHSQGADIIDALDDIASSLGNLSYGEQTSSNKVVAMTGYEKASTAEAISQADTLNEAVGKLEKKVDDNAADITDKVDGPESATVGNIATFNNVDGKTLSDSGVGIATSSTGIGDSDAAVPTSKAVKNYVDATISGTGRYLGTATAVTDLSTTAKEGDYYVVSTAWTGVHVCDVIIAKKDNPSQSIDDTNWSLLHNESNTDANVEQSPVSTNAEYEVLFSHSANNTLETSGVGKDDGITYNPYTNNLTVAGSVSAGGFTGTGVDTATSGSSASGSDTKVPSTKKLNEELGSVVKSVKLTSSDANPITPTNNTVTIPAFAGSGTGHKAGLVPDPGSTSGATKFLREDGSWEVPPGSGGTGNSDLLNGNTVHPEARDITSEAWESKSWSGIQSFDGWEVWSNGANIFYSNESTQKVLNKSTNTWSDITWDETIQKGHDIWSDGENIYYSGGINGGQYVFDKTTNNWITKTWSGSGNYIQGYQIWYDGDVFHYDYYGDHMVRNKSTGEWETKTWSGLDYFYGRYVWTDGENFYYSSDSNQYVLDKSTSTWSAKTWNGLTYFQGYDVWSDGKNIYYSSGSDQYVLDKATSTWTSITWTGLSSFNGERIWTYGDKIYYSNSSNQYILKRNTPTTFEVIAHMDGGLTVTYGGASGTYAETLIFSKG